MKILPYLLLLGSIACHQSSAPVGATTDAAPQSISDAAVNLSKTEEVEEDMPPNPLVIDSSECGQLVNKFFRASSYINPSGQPLDSIYAFVNEVDDSVMVLRLEMGNEQDHFTAGWLSLDLRTKVLTDVIESGNVDSAVVVDYDRTALDNLLSKCSFH